MVGAGTVVQAEPAVRRPLRSEQVALMLQLNPQLTGRQIKQILHDTSVSDSITGSTPNPSWGYGKLNLLQALTAAASAFSASTSSLVFSYAIGGSTPPPQAISITNPGTGLLSWSAGSDVSWIILSPPSGMAPSALNIAVNPAGLSAGV